jgi:hypothetical protein
MCSVHKKSMQLKKIRDKFVLAYNHDKKSYEGVAVRLHALLTSALEEAEW